MLIIKFTYKKLLLFSVKIELEFLRNLLRKIFITLCTSYLVTSFRYINYLKSILADGFYYKADIIKMLKSRGIFTSVRGDGVLASLSQSKTDKWTQEEFFKLVNSLPPRKGLEMFSSSLFQISYLKYDF